MRVEVKKLASIWLINGKRYENCNDVEQYFFREFLTAMKLNYQLQRENIKCPDKLTSENYVG